MKCQQTKFNTENSEFINDTICSCERLHKTHSLTELLQRLGDLCKGQHIQNNTAQFNTPHLTALAAPAELNLQLSHLSHLLLRKFPFFFTTAILAKGQRVYVGKPTVFIYTLTTYSGNNKYEGPELPITDHKHDCLLIRIFINPPYK